MQLTKFALLDSILQQPTELFSTRYPVSICFSGIAEDGMIVSANQSLPRAAVLWGLDFRLLRFDGEDFQFRFGLLPTVPKDRNAMDEALDVVRDFWHFGNSPLFFSPCVGGGIFLHNIKYYLKLANLNLFGEIAVQTPGFCSFWFHLIISDIPHHLADHLP